MPGISSRLGIAKLMFGDSARMVQEKGLSIVSIARKIKSLLPASSRSLHAMHEDIVRLSESNALLLQELQQAKAEYSALNERIDAYEAQTLPLLWDAYQCEGESLHDAKLRFFRSIPKSDGALRDHQDRLAELLHEFDSLCRANGIVYFLATGTLLGAIRHEGFVPWDDDVDVGVMHDDVDRLIEAVRDDGRYVITTLYDQHVFCRQVRFKRVGSDDGKDPFIDLFIYEYSPADTPEELAIAKQLRAEMIAEFEALGQQEPDVYPIHVYLSVGESSRAIQDVYDRYRAKLHELGIYGDEKGAQSIVWGIENVSYGNSTHFTPIEDYRNLQLACFEGSTYPIPQNSERLLEKHYGDWLSIPRDVNTHKHYMSL